MNSDSPAFEELFEGRPFKRWTDAQIWEANNYGVPKRDVMRFVLVYHGPLHSTGNRKRGSQPEIARIRRAFSEQLKILWETSAALRELQEVAWVRNPNSKTQIGVMSTPSGPLTLKQMNDRVPGIALPLWGDLRVGEVAYRPLVRKSLHLSCELDITFLRPEDPGQLVSQAGDLDGRIKTLLDALKMPSEEEQRQSSEDSPKANEHLFCLMESDFLVSSLNVETERLLFPKTEQEQEVYLIVDVSLRVLRVIPENVCLL